MIKDENKACNNEEKRKDMYTSLLKVREQKNKQLQSVYIYIIYMYMHVIVVDVWH